VFLQHDKYKQQSKRKYMHDQMAGATGSHPG